MNNVQVKSQLEATRASILERRQRIARHTEHREAPLPRDRSEAVNGIAVYGAFAFIAPGLIELVERFDVYLDCRKVVSTLPPRLSSSYFKATRASPLGVLPHATQLSSNG